VVDVNTSHTPEEGAHSPSWPNGLIIIVIIIIVNIIIIVIICDGRRCTRSNRCAEKIQPKRPKESNHLHPLALRG
jgi:hypothetical protein